MFFFSFFFLEETVAVLFKILRMHTIVKESIQK